MFASVLVLYACTKLITYFKGYLSIEIKKPTQDNPSKKLQTQTVQCNLEFFMYVIFDLIFKTNQWIRFRYPGVHYVNLERNGRSFNPYWPRSRLTKRKAVSHAKWYAVRPHCGNSAFQSASGLGLPECKVWQVG